MSRNSRRGFSATELVCAAIIVGVIGLTVGPALVFVGRQNRTSAQHLEALNATSNLLEEISKRSYDEVTAESVSQIELPAWLADQLPDATLQLSVEENSGGKRVTAEITWASVSGGPRERESMHAWIFDLRTSA